MKRIIIAVLALLAVTLTGTNALAAAAQGNNELGFGGNILIPHDADLNILILNGRFGHYFTDELLVGGRVTFIGFDGDGVDGKMVDVVAEGKYHFLTQEVVIPYAGALAGVTFLDMEDGSEMGVTVGAFGGAKHYISENTSVFAEYVLTMSYIDSDTQALSAINFGISFLF